MSPRHGLSCSRPTTGPDQTETGLRELDQRKTDNPPCHFSPAGRPIIFSICRSGLQLEETSNREFEKSVGELITPNCAERGCSRPMGFSSGARTRDTTSAPPLPPCSNRPDGPGRPSAGDALLFSSSSPTTAAQKNPLRPPPRARQEAEPSLIDSTKKPRSASGQYRNFFSQKRPDAHVLGAGGASGAEVVRPGRVRFHI